MDPLTEAFQHHIWATERLITHLETLPDAALTSTTEGVYGEILATLSHMVEADDRYLKDLEGVARLPRTGPEVPKPLSELSEQLRDQTVRWRLVLAGIAELDVTIPARGDRPALPHATNLLVAQALHHGTDHRTQICTVLSSNGYESPDLDVWSYWEARRAE